MRAFENRFETFWNLSFLVPTNLEKQIFWPLNEQNSMIFLIFLGFFGGNHSKLSIFTAKIRFSAAKSTQKSPEHNRKITLSSALHEIIIVKIITFWKFFSAFSSIFWTECCRMSWNCGIQAEICQKSRKSSQKIQFSGFFWTFIRWLDTIFFFYPTISYPTI